MLLWEVLRLPINGQNRPNANGKCITLQSQRLPYDKRCVAITKAGTRCRGRIQPGKDCCFFHDPEMTAEFRRRMAAKAAQSRRRLSHLPDGYLRKLSSIAAVGQAMDRLYREVRLGIITPEMGNVLFKVLTRLLDSGLVSTGPHPERSKATRVRPKLRDLLTRTERTAWQKAIENVPATTTDAKQPKPAKTAFERAVLKRRAPEPTAPGPAKLTLQAAS
jgi:hypothetical protein